MTNKYISNHHQIGGIETSILDNGIGRGNRIAWINSGSGLRFKVNFDRGMDIGEAFFNQHCLTWLSHGGIPAPQTLSDINTNWLRTFGGGLLTTCGLQHVGGPESDEFGERGIHGNISNLPAQIESIIQPDPSLGKMEMSITGVIKESKIFGPNLELRRTISLTLGKSEIRIHDEVINKGNAIAPLMVLYHINFGYPLAQEGTQIFWEGQWIPRFGGEYPKIFKEGNDFKTCPAPLENHSEGGEEVALINPTADKNDKCQCGLFNPKLNLKIEIEFYKSQLPYLTNWQHFGRGEYVTGLEPGTNWPIGQKQARENQELLFLEPQATKNFEITLKIKT
jgi:galactose mutarotase-like enzyme